MKLLLAMVILLAISSVSHGETAAPAATPGGTDFQVEVDPKVYPPTAFKNKNVKVGEVPRRITRPDSLPSKQDREKAFALVPGLEIEVTKMDELDRDILYVRAKTKPLKELRNFYPQIAEKKLKLLQKETQK